MINIFARVFQMPKKIIFSLLRNCFICISKIKTYVILEPSETCNLSKQNVWPTEKQCLKVSDIFFPAMYTLSEVVFSNLKLCLVKDRGRWI